MSYIYLKGEKYQQNYHSATLPAYYSLQHFLLFFVAFCKTTEQLSKVFVIFYYLEKRKKVTMFMAENLIKMFIIYQN